MPEEHFITARRSGDEFCMMIYGCAEHADIISHLDAFYQTLKQRAIALSADTTKIISASGGFSWTSDSGCGIEELLSQADEALYDVKRQTKGQYREYRLPKTGHHP